MLAETSSLPQNLRGLLDGTHHTLWIGALSFESRCYGSLIDLKHNDLRITSGIALNYPTSVHPPLEDKERRRNNWKYVSNLQKEICAGSIELRDVDPYSIHQLQQVLEEISQSETDLVVIDITCMTKVHALALAAAMAGTQHAFKWVIAYTVPENYGNLAEFNKAPGWQDIIVAPLTEAALLHNEADSRGIIITGHEADRLIVAFAELEPSGGLIIVADTDKRPDLRYLNEHLNRKMIGQLMRMRSNVWAKTVIALSDIHRLKSYIAKEIILAKDKSAPIIIFPYGPKSLIFFAAYQLASEYPDATWFVYPIPSGYDVNYSEGIEETLWLLPENGL
jgi:hypothetical protein